MKKTRLQKSSLEKLCRKMEKSSQIMLISVLVLSCVNQIWSYDSGGQYSSNASIPLYANKVGPSNNPSETYGYYDLPFCFPDEVIEEKQSLGEASNRDRLVVSPYKLDFLVNKQSEVACSRKLSTEDISKFHLATAQDYSIQFYYDNLPFRVLIGLADRDYKRKPNSTMFFLFTHIWFNIYYNKDRVIAIHTRNDLDITVLDIRPDKEVEVEFLYDVKWHETNISFDKRTDLYNTYALSPSHRQDLWLYVINSCFFILFVLALSAKTYLWNLKKDTSKCSNGEIMADNQEETGWKSLHGDVFRPPINTSLFSAFVGSGTQLVVFMLLIIMLGLLGVIHPHNRGDLITTNVVVYAITSCVAGYSSSSLYMQLEGTDWVKNLMLTAFIFVGPLFITSTTLNVMALTYQVTMALPSRAILTLFCIWLFVGLPSLILGGMLGKYKGSNSRSPCRTNKIPREVPPQRLYRRILLRMGTGGFILFCVACNELSYGLATLWGHRIYTVYSFLLIDSIFLIVIVLLVGVTHTYNHLAFEDHHWWWRAFLNCGSGGIYMFGYCIHYYFWRSDMSGVLQTMFFFGYMACVCYCFFLMLGAVGFYSSFFFVRYIYGAIKCD